MNTKPSSLLVGALLTLALNWGATAQNPPPFRSGSTGAYGELKITENTVLDLPPDGVFHCTTISVAASTQLSFRRNLANTPVYLLATGDVTIEGEINVSGEPGHVQGGWGGPGGFEGGNTTPVNQPGRGPGGAKAGSRHPASHATSGGTGAGPTYGDPLLLSLVGGSGGGAGQFDGGNRGGGGGGGAILIASDTAIHVAGQGTVRAQGARGADGDSNAGSGGEIRLVAPTVTGNGFLLTDAGGIVGGVGRVRVDSANRTGFAFSVQGAYAAGANLVARLPDPPTLRITHAAGTDLAPGVQGVVRVLLPNGSPAEQPLRIEATGFKALVPIRVTLYPETGEAVEVDDTLDNTQGGTTAKTLTLSFPVNNPTRVYVWTRSP